LASEDFTSLVERTRQATNDVCEKAKLILRRLLPNVEALQKDNASFSPRLMILMLSRVGEELSSEDRKSIHDMLQHAEAFQPQLIAWMMAVKGRPASAVSEADVRECADALELTRSHSSALDALLEKVGGGRRAS